MNRNELRLVLAHKRVDERLYSIDSLARQSESYSIVKDGDTWKVLYKERGEFTDIATGLTEDEACEFVYREFRNMFGWKN